MESSSKHKLMAGVLSMALLPATTALGNDWSKPKSRTRGTAIGAVAGALVAGPPGAVIGGALGNGVQAARHTSVAHRHHHYRHHRR
jgi:MFS family permease